MKCNETKPNHSNRNETKRNGTQRNTTQRNATVWKRNEICICIKMVHNKAYKLDVNFVD